MEHFFENLLFGARHDLKNRYLHIAYKENLRSVEDASPAYGNSQNDSVNDSVKLTAGQKAILNHIKDHPFITQSKLAQQTGLSVSTVIRQMKKLQAAGLLRRVGADKNGYRKVEENRR